MQPAAPDAHERPTAMPPVRAGRGVQPTSARLRHPHGLCTPLRAAFRHCRFGEGRSAARTGVLVIRTGVGVLSLFEAGASAANQKTRKDVVL